MTFEQWWDSEARTPAPDTYKNWEESCRLTWIAAQAAQPGWMPIASAPKDGSRIVVGYGRQSTFPVKTVFFNTIHNHWSHYGEADIGLEANATHWMPLPPPPIHDTKEQS